jgi:RimJ/RimL family protein N-acetyltransferase
VRDAKEGTGRLRLDCGLCTVREWSAGDRSDLVRVANNRNVWRNLTHRFPHPYTEADADSWFARLASTPHPTHWAIEVDGVAAGGIGMEPGEGIFAKSAQFGYWLGQPYWGRGITTAAARATSDALLESFDVVRLEAPVFAWNPASMRVLEKCGFVREGVLRRSVYKDGEIIDAVLYARVR